MNNVLKSKKILFFSPSFFGYEEKIKNKMTEMGADVDMYDERSVRRSIEKSFLKVVPYIFNWKTEKYYKDILKKESTKKYDYILIIKCDMPTIRILKLIKQQFPNAKLCLHMWDSMKNIPNIKKKLFLFDYITSFDRQDCKAMKSIFFRPLFYADEYISTDNTSDKYKYDMCFIGTIHSDRYKILKEIEKQAKKDNLTFFFYPYLQSKFIYYFYKFTKKEFRNTKKDDFQFSKISSSAIARKINESRIVIDIQHPKQTGLTMRTIEMLGMKKQVITTNFDIENYDFYDAGNIATIDRKNLEIKLNQFSLKYKDIDSKIYNKYSLDCWICDVLGEGI